MLDSDKMLRQRQAATTTFRDPGPPALPISTNPLPIPTNPLSSTDGVRTTTESFSDITFTLTISSNPISSPNPTTGFQTSSIQTSNATSPSTLTTPTSTASIPPPTPSSPISFAFLNPSNSTTCATLPIEWRISNVADPTTVNIDLGLVSISNNDLNMTLTTGWPMLRVPFTWQSVSVPPGQYEITGRFSDGSGTLAHSSAFEVQAGSDTSCVTGGGVNPINTAAKSVNKGAIAGGTVGGVIILGCILVALFFLVRTRPRRGNKRVRESRRTWGGLGSVDDKTSASRHLEPSYSDDYLSTGVASHPTPIPASSSSLTGEKLSPTTPSPIGALPTLEHKAPWETPAALELARLSSHHNTHDSPRSSLESPRDPFHSPPSRRASRTPRKPVPAYEPTSEELEAMTMARTGSAQSRARSTHSDVVAHQPSTSLSTSSGSPHELLNKSSGLFDGQPVHYLIPDMPPQPPS